MKSSGSRSDIFVLPYNESDEQFVKYEVLDLIKKKPIIIPEPEIGSADRPYAWTYILTPKDKDTLEPHKPKLSISHTQLAESRMNYGNIKLKEEPSVPQSHHELDSFPTSFRSNYSSDTVPPSPNDYAVNMVTRSDSPLTNWEQNDEAILARYKSTEQKLKGVKRSFELLASATYSDPPLIHREYNMDSPPDSAASSDSGGAKGLNVALKTAMWAQRSKSRMKERYREVRDSIMKLANRKKIQTHVIKQKKPLPLPYHSQGNLGMYSDSNIRKRMLLKQDDTLRMVIEHWWHATIKSVTNPTMITKIAYLSLAMAVYSIMMPDDAGKTLEDARKHAERDWREDSGGAIEMGFAQFFDAVFELADLWCETTGLEEYVMFLDVLFQKAYLDYTLPSVIRKHINHKYINILLGKVKPVTTKQKSDSSRTKTKKKRKQKKKIVSKIEATPPTSAKQKDVEEKVTKPEQTYRLEDLIDTVVEPPLSQREKRPPLEWIGMAPKPKTPRLNLEDDKIPPLKTFTSSNTQTPRGDIDLDFDINVRRMIDRLSETVSLQNTFVYLLKQNDKYTLERTIFDRMMNGIKDGNNNSFSNGMDLITMLNQRVISEEHQNYLRVGDKINLLGLLDVVVQMMNMEDEVLVTPLSDELERVKSARSVTPLRKNLTERELQLEKQEFMGKALDVHQRKTPRSARSNSSANNLQELKAKLSDHTWEKLLKFAEELSQNSLGQMLGLPDESTPTDPHSEDLIQRVYEEAIQRYDMQTTDDNMEQEEVEIVQMEDENLITDSASPVIHVDVSVKEEEEPSVQAKVKLNRLFSEVEFVRDKAQSLIHNSTTPKLVITERHFQDSPRTDSGWSGKDFFQRHVNRKILSRVSEYPESPRSIASSTISEWWDNEADAPKLSARNIVLSKVDVESKYAYSSVKDLYPDAEELFDVVRQLSVIPHYDSSTFAHAAEYKLSKRDQTNILLVSEEPKNVRASSSKSWFPSGGGVQTMQNNNKIHVPPLRTDTMTRPSTAPSLSKTASRTLLENIPADDSVVNNRRRSFSIPTTERRDLTHEETLQRIETSPNKLKEELESLRPAGIRHLLHQKQLRSAQYSRLSVHSDRYKAGRRVGTT
jgi:hypothetical protein